jgi:ATP-dependent RNA helicase DDX55/SPB4
VDRTAQRLTPPAVGRTRALTPHAPRLHPLQVGAVIVSPTRELAKQIFDVAAPYLAGVCVAPPMLLVGGSDPRLDVDALKARGAFERWSRRRWSLDCER